MRPIFASSACLCITPTWVASIALSLLFIASPLNAQDISSLTSTQLEQLKQLPAGELEKLRQEALRSPKAPQIDPLVVTPTPTTVQPTSAVEREAKSVTEKSKLTDPKEEKAIKQGLKLFGYDLFQGSPSTFAPVSEVPVTPDYMLGPGDTVQVNTYGARNEQMSLVVSREGMITFPGIGPIVVSGQTFESMSEMLLKRIEAQLIGVKATITMGVLRSMRIFILGEATRPGAYTVSSMSTLTNALFVSGGVKTIGSLRNIALRRHGKVVATIDLYDLLMKGDTSNDARLLPGDVIFIPKIGETVGVAGEVLRPAIYEIKHEKLVADLIGLAGGLLPTAFPQATQIERIDSRRQKTIVDADQTVGKAKKLPVQDGDMIRVYSILDRMDKIVLLSGHVHRPGGMQWRNNMRITDLISGYDDLLPRPEMSFLIIKREVMPDRRIELVRANLAQALADPAGAFNIELKPRDEVLVFPQDGDRSKTLFPLLDQVKRQARSGLPSLVVDVNGAITAPGQYPMTSGMRISDLLILSGSLREDAFQPQAELSRYAVGVKNERVTKILPINLAAVLSGDKSHDLELQPFDSLLIKSIPDWNEKITVDIAGKVRFPGRYQVTRGEKLSSVLSRAGGYVDTAAPEGAIFLRERLRNQEQDSIDRLAERIQSELASASVRAGNAAAQAGGNAAGSVAMLDSMLKNLKSTKAVGRLAIDLPNIRIGANSNKANALDVTLEDGDKLFVPSVLESVTVSGEVNYPSSHRYEPDLGLQAYLERAGGATQNADEARIFVIRANGVVQTISKGWLSWATNNEEYLLAGDTIVVPPDVRQIAPIALWSSVSQIFSNIAVSLAAMKSIGVLK